MTTPSNNSNDDIKQLYERFKVDLAERPADMYYDEDDIIMVYDLAGDYQDRYVQLHALMLGRRLYPGSEQLELRLGLAMLDMYDEVSLDDFLRNNAGRTGLLWEIIRLRGHRVKVDELPERLEELLDRYAFEEDEEIIQFVNLITAYECEHWLVENYRRFVDRCRYRDTALSECAEVVRYYDTKLSISLVEELTRIDPFNADAWIKLAEFYRDNGDKDEGLAAVEYAKALRPDDYLPLYVEATLLTTAEPDSQRAAELLQQAIKINPDMFEAKVALSDVYDYQGKSDLAEMIWREELRRDPENEVAKNRLALIRSAGENDQNWCSGMSEDEFARHMEMIIEPGTEPPETIVRMLAAYDRKYGLYQLAGEYIKHLYRCGMLEELCRFMERDRPEGCPEMRLDPPSLPLYAAALLREGRYSEAASTARECLVKTGQVCTNVELSMAFAGVKITLEYILERALEGNYNPDRDPVAESMNM